MLSRFRRSFLTSATFVRRAYDELRRVPQPEFFSRAGPTKQLIEEVLPLAAFLKHIELPDQRVRCRYYGPTSPFDARIALDGHWVRKGIIEPHYYIEITTAIAPRAHLHREALRRYGSVFHDPDIQREGIRREGTDRIVSKARALDASLPPIEVSTWIATCIAKKILNHYPQPCILLVNAEPASPLDFSEWATVRAGLASVNKGWFAYAYVVNWNQNLVFNF